MLSKDMCYGYTAVVVQYLGRVCLLNRSRYPGPGRDASRFTGALDLLTEEQEEKKITFE